MNPLRCAVLVLLAASALWLSSTVAAASGSERGLLWRIEHDGEAVGHLFGTIHSDRPEILDLPAPVERAFGNAERYDFEVDHRDIDPFEVARIMHYRDGGSLPQRLPAPLWQRVQWLLEQRGLPPQAVTRLEPWALATLLSLPPSDPNQILDMVLQRRARSLERPVTGLESVDEQLSVFDRLPPERQIEALATAVDLVESGRAQAYFERVVGAWLQRDLARIVELSDAVPALADPGANDRLMRDLVDRRNERMVERMQPLLDAGGAFVAIGALHLPGDNGLIRLLERRGYTVTAVY